MCHDQCYAPAWRNPLHNVMCPSCLPLTCMCAPPCGLAVGLYFMKVQFKDARGRTFLMRKVALLLPVNSLPGRVE